MTGPASRRGFLRDLVGLPLIGGGLTLIGSPTAVAGTPPRECVESYLAWLHYECRAVHDAHYAGPSMWIDGKPGRSVPLDNEGAQFHFNERCAGPGWGLIGQEALARAPLVLAAVGCDWREGGR